MAYIWIKQQLFDWTSGFVYSGLDNLYKQGLINASLADQVFAH